MARNPTQRVSSLSTASVPASSAAGGDPTEAERGVCRVSFRPSATVLDGVGCLLSEFFSSQLEAEVASSFARVAEDLLRGWVRPGLDQSARVRLSLWSGLLQGTLDAQVSFTAPADDASRLLALIERLGRSSGQFSYRLLPRATHAVGTLVRAEGSINTDVRELGGDECVVCSTLSVQLSTATLAMNGLDLPPRAPGSAR